MQGWPARLLDDDQRLAWLMLMRSENVGPVLFYQLIDHFGSAQVALEALPHLSRRGGRKKPVRVFPRAAAEEEMARLEALGARLVARGEAGYPPLLAHMEAPPPLLAIRGNAALAEEPPVAIVGARRASANGRVIARTMGQQLAERGYVVVSGLALGIDAAAHEGGLAHQGRTIAVMACGIDVAYPERNAKLMEAIAERGLLISEMPPGTVVRPELFPRRNRLVAGMSLGVVVVEAARRSGSLITARLAAEAGRHVMAVPGSPLDGRAAGCNHLIREGATLVRHAADVDEMLAQEAAQLRVELRERAPFPAPEPRPARRARETQTGAAPSPAPASSPLEPAEDVRARLLALVGAAPVEQDVLLRECGAPPEEALAALMELELAGRLSRLPDGRLARSG